MHVLSRICLHIYRFFAFLCCLLSPLTPFDTTQMVAKQHKLLDKLSSRRSLFPACAHTLLFTLSAPLNVYCLLTLIKLYLTSYSSFSPPAVKPRTHFLYLKLYCPFSKAFLPTLCLPMLSPLPSLSGSLALSCSKFRKQGLSDANRDVEIAI